MIRLLTRGMLSAAAGASSGLLVLVLPRHCLPSTDVVVIAASQRRDGPAMLTSTAQPVGVVVVRRPRACSRSVYSTPNALNTASLGSA